MQKIEHNKITWLNYFYPRAKDLLFLKEEFRVTVPVLEQLTVPIKRPKIEEYPNFLFLVLHFPVFDEKNRQTMPTEIDFIITRNCIITVYQDPIPTLESFFEHCYHQASIREEYFINSGYLFFCILDKLIDSCLPMLDHISENIERIENKVFQGHEKEMLLEIAIVKRDIIDFRRTIKPQRSVLEILSKKASRFFGYDMDFISQETIGSNIRVWNTLENHKEMIEAIEETNNSLLSYKLNNVLKILTLVSFIILPLSLIANIFAMDTAFTFSLYNSEVSFWAILASMICIGFLIFIYFKRKKWL